MFALVRRKRDANCFDFLLTKQNCFVCVVKVYLFIKKYRSLFCLVILLSTGFAIRADEESGKLDASGPGTQARSYTEVPDRFYNAAFVSWMGPDNLMQRRGLSDPAAIEAWADRLAGLGVAGVEYAGRHFRWNHVQEWDLINDIAARMVEACHRRGLFVIEHHDFPIATVYGFPELTRRLHWLQRDVRTGEPMRWFDPLHPEFQQAYIQYLTTMQKRAGFDGFMLDEMMPAPFVGTASPETEHLIKEQTGFASPAWVRHPDPDLADPAYRAWSRWKNNVESEALEEIYGALRRQWPEIAGLTYSSVFSFPNGYSDLTVSAARFSNFVGFESITFDPLNGWQGLLRELKERGALADYFHIPLWVLLREPRTAEQLYFGWVLAQLTRHSTWMGGSALRTDEQLDAMGKYLRWKERMPHRYARTLADTGVLLSMQTRNSTTNTNFFWNDFTGWNSVLVETSRQFDVLLDGDLQAADRTGKYHTLVLASQACLSEAQCRHLKDWVSAGGTVIFTRNTSLFDENGAQRKDFALGEAANISFVRELEGEVPVEMGSELADLRFPAGVTHAVRLRQPGRSQVLARASTEHGEIPVIVETPHGKGRFIYVAADFGSTQSQPELKGTVYPGMRRPEIRRVMELLLDRARTSTPPIDLFLPKGVVGTAFQQWDGDDAGTIFVQLVNVRGMTLKAGEQTRLGQIPPFSTPPIAGSIRLALQGVKVTGPARAESPELKESVEIQPSTGIDGSVEFSIPGALLNAYLQVRIPAEKWSRITPPPVPIKVADAATEATNEEVPAQDGGATSGIGLTPVARTITAIPPEGAKGESVFTFSDGEGLQMKIHGKPLVVADGLEFAENHIAPVADAEHTSILKTSDVLPVRANHWSGYVSHGKVPWGASWVREAAAQPRRAEITTLFRLPPERHPDGFGAVRYVLYIPVAALAGAEYTAYAGMYKKPDPRVRGKFTGDEPEAEVFLKHLRTLAVDAPVGAFTLDFDWSGPSGLFETEIAMGQTAHVRREGDRYAFAVEFIHVRNGGDFFGKAIFYEGLIQPEDLHPVRSGVYYIPPPASARIQFTGGDPVQGFTQWKHFGFGYDQEYEAWGTGRWNELAGRGWTVPPQNGSAINPAPDSQEGPLFGGGVRGSGPAEFALRHRNGHAIVSVMLPRGENAVRVRVNSGKWREVGTKAGRRTELFPVHITNEKIRVEIDGPEWMLSGVSVQPLIFESEDVIFGRNYWAFGTPPWKVNAFPRPEQWDDIRINNFGPRPLIPEQNE